MGRWPTKKGHQSQIDPTPTKDCSAFPKAWASHSIILHVWQIWTMALDKLVQRVDGPSWHMATNIWILRSRFCGLGDCLMGRVCKNEAVWRKKEMRWFFLGGWNMHYTFAIGNTFESFLSSGKCPFYRETSWFMIEKLPEVENKKEMETHFPQSCQMFDLGFRRLSGRWKHGAS